MGHQLVAAVNAAALHIAVLLFSIQTPQGQQHRLPVRLGRTVHMGDDGFAPVFADAHKGRFVALKGRTEPVELAI